MTLWPWTRLPPLVQDGLLGADPAVLGSFCDWLHSRIARRITADEDADLAQQLTEEIRRMMYSPSGRVRLCGVRNLPAFLETLAQRLSRAAVRRKREYEAALSRFVTTRRVPDPAEHLAEQELIYVILGATSNLNSTARQIVQLALAGATPREIAKSIWGKRADSRTAHRVSVVLARSREKLRSTLTRAFALQSRRATSPPEKKRDLTPWHPTTSVRCENS
jgi:hypothetical protein